MTECSLTDAMDRVMLDLTRAYAVASLRSLTRAFEFDRAGRGALTVCDRVAFDSPQEFGVALVTYGEAHEESPGVWIISKDKVRVRVEIDAGDADFTVTNEILRDESRIGKVRRLGINLLLPSAGAEVRLRITSPDAPPR